MPDIDQTIAAQVRPPQSSSDVVGPITSLAQMQYWAAKGQEAAAQAGLIGQQTQAAQFGLSQQQSIINRMRGGALPESVAPELAVTNPAGAKDLNDVTLGGLNITGRRNYAANPTDPYSAAASGPEAVTAAFGPQEKQAGIAKTKADTASTLADISGEKQANQERAKAAFTPIKQEPGQTITYPQSLADVVWGRNGATTFGSTIGAPSTMGGPQSAPAPGQGGPGLAAAPSPAAPAAAETSAQNLQHNTQAYGQIGTMMVSDPSPAGRQKTAQTALQMGADPTLVKQFMSLPDDQYVAAGRHFQAAALNPQPYVSYAPQGPTKAAFSPSGPNMPAPASAPIPGNGSAVYNGLIARGFSPVQAAALAGNIQQESGFNPSAVNGKEGALGFLQWEGPRRAQLEQFAAARGTSPADPNTQLDFIKHEMGGSEAGSAAPFLKASNLQEANAALKGYIRYGDQSAAQRLAYANRFAGGNGYVIAPGATFGPNAGAGGAVMPATMPGVPAPAQPQQPQQSQPQAQPGQLAAPPAQGATPISTAPSAPTGPAPGSTPVTPPGTPAAVSPTGPVVQPGMSLAEKARQEALGKGEADATIKQYGEAKEGYQQASTAQSSLHQLMGDLGDLPSSGLLTPGSHAEERLGLAKTINTIVSAAGGQPIFDPKQIAAAEGAQKVTGRLGFDLARTMGSREAAQIITKSISLNPGMENTPQGARVMAASIDSALQRQRDFYSFLAAHKGDPEADLKFNQLHPPSQYVQEAQRLATIPQKSIALMQSKADDPKLAAFFDKHYGDGMSRYFTGQ